MKKSQFRASILAASALSASIASQLHAVIITSNNTGGGIWEVGASWAGGVRPDTFAGDSAVINLGDVITFDDANADGSGGLSTPATPFTTLLGIPAGGLAVANGNSITIDGAGSRLTQANLFNEIRIGDGKGATSGVGTMNINNEGLFASGSAVGVAVGSDIDDNATHGLGTVNLNDGRFIMQIGPAAPAGLGVGIEGSTGFFNVGDGIAGVEATLNLELNGNDLGIGVTNQIGSTAGTGTVTVKSDGQLIYSTGAILVGDTTAGLGTLQINGGRLGNGAIAQGNVTIGSNGGRGNFNVTAGSIVDTASNLIVGTGAGSIGIANITGGSVVFGNNVYNDGAATPQKLGSTRVGRDGGTGTLTITAGATFETGAEENTNSKGLFIGTGATGSTGTVSINGGTMIQHGWAEIGGGAGNTGTLEVKNNGVYSHLENGRDLQIGYNGGRGTVRVESGGQLTTNWWINIARGGGSQGDVTVDGATSIIKMGNGQLNVGEDGIGSLDLKNGGTFLWNAAGDTDGTVGRNNGSNGTLNINTGGVFNGLSNPAQGDPGARHGLRLYLGAFGGTAQGTLNMLGGSLSLLSFTPGNSGKATVNHTGGTINVGQWAEIGQDRNADVATDVGLGIVGNEAVYNLSGTGVLNAQQLIVGSRRKGTMQMTAGTVNIGTDGTVTNPGWGTFSIGQFGTPDGGSHGDGLLNQTGGTINSLSNGDAYIGNQAGTAGVYNISGTGIFQALTDGGNPDVGARRGTRLIVGNSYGAQGALNIGVGATVNVRHLTVGQDGKGSVTQDGGIVTVGQWLKIAEGNNGGGTDDATNEAVYTLNNGEINTPELMIGEARKGTMNVHGGTVNIQNGGFGIGRWGPAPNHGDGVLNHDGGTINSRNGGGNGTLFVGLQNGSKGVYNISGTAVINNINDLLVAREGGSLGSQGTVNVNFANPASEMVTNAWLYVGGGTNSVGNVKVDNGVFRVSGQSRIGYNNGGGGTGIVTVNGAGSTFIANDETFVGLESSTANGTINNNGGTVNINHWLNVGRNDATGTINMTSGTMTVRDEARFGVNFGGSGGNGKLIQSGGSFTTGRDTQVGQNPGAIGLIDLSGTALYTANGNTHIGESNGTGRLKISGAASYVANAEFWIGNGRGNGTLDMTGGSITANSWVGIGRDGGTGTVNLSGGTITKGPVNGTFDIGVFGNLQAFQITNFATADTIIAGGPNLAYSFAGTYTTSNTQDNGDAGGPFGLGVQVQGLPGGDNNDFAFVGLGNFTVSTTGSYIFGNNTDDGSRLRLSINGGVFTEIISDNVLSGPHTVSSAAQALTAGDTIRLDWMWFERGGGAEGETFYSRNGGPNALWEDPSQGLTLAGGQYTGTVYKSKEVLTVGTGTLIQTGGSVVNTVSDTNIGRDGNSIGVWTISGGTATLANLVIGRDGGSTGTLNLNAGGVIAANAVIAGGGTSTLKFAGGTLRARQDEADFIRGFTNTGTHSGIGLNGPGGTIDSNGFRVKVTASSSFTTDDGNSSNGLAGAVLTIAGDATLFNDTDKVTIQVPIGSGTVSLHALPGSWVDLEVSQTLDALVIDNGAMVEFSALNSPPGSPLAEAGGFDAAAAEGMGGASVQGVPEPGSLSLLIVSALGMLGRRSRRKDS